MEKETKHPGKGRSQRKRKYAKLPRGLKYFPGKHWVIDTDSMLGAGSEGSVYPCIPSEEFGPETADSSVWQYVCKISTRSISRHCAYDSVKELSHPNLVIPIEETHHRKNNNLYSILPRYDFDAFELLDTRGPVPESTLRSIMVPIVEALSVMHSRCIAHRDLKHENILIKLASNGKDIDSVGLTDFGLSIQGSERQPPTSRGLTGSIDFLPPEAFRRSNSTGRSRPYDALKGDIWALGVLMVFLLSGSGVGRDTHQRKVELPKLSVSKKLKQALVSCLQWKGENRPDAASLSALPWFQKQISGQRLNMKKKPSKRVLLTAETGVSLSKPRALQRIPTASTGVTKMTGTSPQTPSTLGGREDWHYDLTSAQRLAVLKARKQLKKSGVLNNVRAVVTHCWRAARSATLEIMHDAAGNDGELDGSRTWKGLGECG